MKRKSAYTFDARRAMLDKLPPERRAIVEKIQHTNEWIDDCVQIARRPNKGNFLTIKSFVETQIENEKQAIREYLGGTNEA